jgi:hypothetical protein
MSAYWDYTVKISMKGPDELITKALSVFDTEFTGVFEEKQGKGKKGIDERHKLFKKKMCDDWGAQFERCGSYDISQKRTIPGIALEAISFRCNETEGTVELYDEFLRPLIETFPELTFFVIAEYYSNDDETDYHFEYLVFENGDVDQTYNDGYIDGDFGNTWQIEPDSFDPEIHGSYFEAITGDSVDKIDTDYDPSWKNHPQCDYLEKTEVKPVLAAWILAWGQKPDDRDPDDDEYEERVEDTNQSEELCRLALETDESAVQYIHTKKVLDSLPKAAVKPKAATKPKAKK